ncbi:MAG: TIR domain-containing protein [Anaerovoracaceae bacterium]
MAHKTFISYKYSESTELRDRIIAKLGSDSTYYKGEDGYSNDLSSYAAETIKRRLSDMIYDTTVMIVIISPNMKQSEWMEWEIKYALREQSRNGRTSHPDGVVCVVQKQATSIFAYSRPYAWAETTDGKSWLSSKFFQVLLDNMKNKKSWTESSIISSNKALYDRLSSNYVEIVTEDDFLKNSTDYIERAFEKSENIGTYTIVKGY